MSDLPPRGSGPLAGDVVTGGPIDDPTTTDRANPRWEDPSSPAPDAQPLSNPDGSTDVLPPNTFPQMPGDLPDPQGDPLSGPDTFAGTAPDRFSAPGTLTGDESGTPQDQAAQPLEGQLEVGRDNIREGRGDTQSNPALAEGGDNG